MRQSAGLLLYRVRESGIEVLLVHPGGPFWVRRDEGAWSIPKGEFEANEAPLAAARREFLEETGAAVGGRFDALTPVRQAGGKRVHAFAIEAEFDPATLASNTFEIEWPPRSGRVQHFPEIDRAEWFTVADAASRMHPAQRAWLAEVERLASRGT